MKKAITMSSKGQITLPAEVRKFLDFKQGDELSYDINAKAKSVEIRKVLSIDELSAKLSKYIKPGTKPLLNVDEYYQKHRKPRI